MEWSVQIGGSEVVEEELVGSIFHTATRLKPHTVLHYRYATPGVGGVAVWWSRMVPPETNREIIPRSTPFLGVD
jgi:hypothetical protein